MAKIPNGGNRAPIKDIYVARTVVEKQPVLERFLYRFAKKLGRGAIVAGMGSAHLTYLEGSGGVRDVLRSQGFTPDDVRQLKGNLQLHIDATAPRFPMPVPVDEDRPLVWRGGRSNSLALKIVPTEELLEERTVIEGFLKERFGRLPTLRTFDPHITIGRADGRFLSREQRQDPQLLMPTGLVPPQTVVLNGLMTYLNRITD